MSVSPFMSCRVKQKTKHIQALTWRWYRDKSGGVAVYAAIFSMLALSAGSVSVDLGRLITLKSQLQHRADAGALAGAVQLDGTDGSMERARDVAMNGTTDESNISRTTGELAVGAVNFYSDYETRTVAAVDRDARVIEVTMTPQLVDFFFTPFLDMLLEAVAEDSMSVTASSVAQYAPLMCNAPPLMVCDLTETGGEDVMSTANSGRQILAKAPQGGSNSWVPGNFGLLESGYGSGANNLERSLADIEPPGCDTTVITTEPGTMANRVQNGVNARFNDSPYLTPAPNVISYPRDTQFQDFESNDVGGERLGDGNWDPEEYWSDNHFGAELPVDLENATRFQVYLYELGEEYAKDGNHTLYPIPDEVPDGYTTVNPPSEDMPLSGEPDFIPASNGALRRVMQVAVLRCVEDDVKGRGDYPTDGNYIEVFITEPVGDPPDTAIFGEIIGPIYPDAEEMFHRDAQLLD